VSVDEEGIYTFEIVGKTYEGILRELK